MAGSLEFAKFVVAYLLYNSYAADELICIETEGRLISQKNINLTTTKINNLCHIQNYIYRSNNIKQQ